MKKEKPNWTSPLIAGKKEISEPASERARTHQLLEKTVKTHYNVFLLDSTVLKWTKQMNRFIVLRLRTICCSFWWQAYWDARDSRIYMANANEEIGIRSPAVLLESFMPTIVNHWISFLPISCALFVFFYVPLVALCDAMSARARDLAHLYQFFKFSVELNSWWITHISICLATVHWVREMVHVIILPRIIVVVFFMSPSYNRLLNRRLNGLLGVQLCFGRCSASADKTFRTKINYVQAKIFNRCKRLSEVTAPWTGIKVPSFAERRKN